MFLKNLVVLHALLSCLQCLPCASWYFVYTLRVNSSAVISKGGLKVRFTEMVALGEDFIGDPALESMQW